MQVSEKFYNEEFLPWYLKCQTEARFYGMNSYLPSVEMACTEKVKFDIKTVIHLIQDYFLRSLKTPIQYHDSFSKISFLKESMKVIREDSKTTLDEKSFSSGLFTKPKNLFSLSASTENNLRLEGL